MRNKSSKKIGACCFLLVILAFFSLIHVSVFEIYDELSIYTIIAVLAVCLAWYSFSRFDLIIAILTVVYMLISKLINEGGIGSILTYFSGILFLLVFAKVSFTVKHKIALQRICCCVILVLSLLSLLYIKNYWAIYRSDYLLNPNTYSIFLIYAYMLYICLSEKKLSVAKQLLLTAVTMAGVYNYRSRSMIIALIVFCLLQFIKQTWRTPKKAIFWSLVLVAVGLSIPFLYLFLYNNDIKLEIMGKSLFTGREELWSNMMKAFDNDPIKIFFGLGSKINLGKETLNLHNNMFVVIVNFGVLGFLLYMAVLCRYMWKACMNTKHYKCYRWYTMFVASVLVLGMSETVSFWGATMVFAYLGLGMATNIRSES